MENGLIFTIAAGYLLVSTLNEYPELQPFIIQQCRYLHGLCPSSSYQLPVDSSRIRAPRSPATTTGLYYRFHSGGLQSSADALVRHP